MRKIQERLRKAQEAMRQQQLEKEGKTGEGSKTTDENQENNPPPLQFFYQPITLEQLINMVVSYPPSRIQSSHRSSPSLTMKFPFCIFF